MRCLFRLEAEEEENYKDRHLPDISVFVWVMAVAVWILTVLSMAAVCQAAPSRPVGYYTFDGKSLRPLNVVQRRSDDDGFSFGGRHGWKLPFAKPSFLSALTDRGDDDERPTVSSDHLLPDYLTHQEFLKPQLQAAGFSGGRIIAGPFPVPVAGLPKPPPRSGTVAPPAPPSTTSATKIKLQQTTQSSLPAFIYKATPPPSYKPVQFPAVQSVPAKVVAARPPPPPPPQQQPKLVYTIPTSSPVHWHAAHQSGPERPASSLGVVSYSHPAALVSETAGGSTRLSYGGWTPIYSASYAHVQTQQDPVASVQSLQLEPPSEIRQLKKEPIIVEAALVPERQVVNQPEAQQSLEEQLEPVVIDLVPRVIIPGSASPITESTATPETKSDLLPSTTEATPVVIIVGASAADDNNNKKPIETPTASAPVVTEAKRTVRKRKAKQVPSSKRRNSVDGASSSSSLSSDRAINQEVAIVTASSSPALADDPSSSSSSLPALSSRGQGQGRYVGRVLPASVFDDDQQPVAEALAAEAPLGWRQITPLGYTLRLTDGF